MELLLKMIDRGDQETFENLVMTGIIKTDDNYMKKNYEWYDDWYILFDNTYLHVLLRYAIEKGNTGITRFLMEYGYKVPTTMNTLLLIALKGPYVDIVRLLLEKGHLILKNVQIDETPLVLAAKTKNEEIIDLILQKLQSIENGSGCDLEEFHVACIKGHLDIIDKIIRSGVSVNERVPLVSLCCPRYTPLQLAVRCGHYEVVQHLLDSGADVNAKSMEGMTALHIAVQLVSSSKDIVKLLLQRGASISATLGTTTLHIAAKYSDPDVVGVLLENGAKANTFDEAGLTPLHIAIQHGNVEVAKLLTDKADVNCADKTEKETPLHFVVNLYYNNLMKDHDLSFKEKEPPLRYTTCEERLEIAALLLTYGADINLRNKKGQTPLHYLLELMSLHSFTIVFVRRKGLVNTSVYLVEIIKLIVSSQRHCSKLINPIDEHGFSHFHAACRCGDSKIVFDFLKGGADVNQSVKEDSKNWPLYTPLLFAFHSRCKETVTLLLEHGAYINPATGTTILHEAVRYMDKEFVGMLLENGAPVNVSGGNFRNTPLHIAVKRNDLGMIKLLIQYKADVVRKNSSSLTPLMIAADFRKTPIEIIQTLFEEERKANIVYCTEHKRKLLLPALFAAFNERRSELDMKKAAYFNKLITYILRADGDINAVNYIYEFEKPLIAYAYEMCPSFFYVLLQYGTDITLVEKYLQSKPSSGSDPMITNISAQILYDHKEKIRVRIFRAIAGFFPKT